MVQYTSQLRARGRPATRTARGANAEASSRPARREALLRALGAAVRGRRSECGLTMRVLAERAQVSERFLVQLESGEGNISVARLEDIAEALQTSAAELLASAHATSAGGASARGGVEFGRLRRGIVALIGLRGAGKSAIGAEIARRMGAPFVELDALVAREAGMALGTIFEMHGEAYFRKLEREALRKFLDGTARAVLATGGSIVTAPDTFELLRQRTTTVWLKARAKDHWDRVVAQGDVRPMQNRANAMSELKALLRARKPLYAQADYVVDTSGLLLREATANVVALVDGAGR